MRGGASELERGFRRDGLDVGRAAHTVRAEDFFWLAHGFLSALGGISTPTLGGSTFTSVTPGGVETSTRRRSSLADAMSVRSTTARIWLACKTAMASGGPLTVTETTSGATRKSRTSAAVETMSTGRLP